MPVFAVTMFFEDNRHSLGWSETYYGTFTDFAAVNAAINSFCDLRVAILTDIFKLAFVRISNTAVTGDSQIVTPPNQVGDIDDSTDPSCEPWTCLMLRLEASPTSRGRKYHHGVPRSFFDVDRLYDPANANAAHVTDWVDELKAGTWSIKHRTGVGPPATYSYPVIDAVIPQRQVIHQIGRPFGLLRGRR